MEDADIPATEINVWQPITDKVAIAYLGKLGEELTEGGTAIFRCIIQGVQGSEPTTGKVNQQWLEEEIADVLAMLDHVIPYFELDEERISLRRKRKYGYKSLWFAALKAEL